MSTTQTDTISILNHLIETLKDGQEGFQAAAKDVESDNLRALFNGYSLQRAKFAGELQAEAHSLGESNPENSGSVAGAIHRGWIDIKSAFSGKDDHAILEECERGEDSAVAEFREALSHDNLPANIRNVLENQYTEVLAVHNHIRDLRDTLAK